MLTLYNNININTNSHFQNFQSYMLTYIIQKYQHKNNNCCPNAQSYICTYHIQEHKHIQKDSFQKKSWYQIFTYPIE